MQDALGVGMFRFLPTRPSTPAPRRRQTIYVDFYAFLSIALCWRYKRLILRGDITARADVVLIAPSASIRAITYTASLRLPRCYFIGSC